MDPTIYQWKILMPLKISFNDPSLFIKDPIVIIFKWYNRKLSRCLPFWVHFEIYEDTRIINRWWFVHLYFLSIHHWVHFTLLYSTTLKITVSDVRIKTDGVRISSGNKKSNDCFWLILLEEIVTHDSIFVLLGVIMVFWNES